MNNHIDRHGLMGKKTGDGRRRVYVQLPSGPAPAKTSLSHRLPSAGCCGFNHKPYVSDISYHNSSYSKPFGVWTTMALLTSGAKSCEFCHTIWLGLQQYRPSWEANWNRLSYLDVLADHMSEYTNEEYSSLVNMNPYGFDPVPNRPVNEDKIYLSLAFPPEKGYVEVRLIIEPRDSRYGRNRLLMAFDYFTLEGSPSPWGAFGKSPQVSLDVLSENSTKRISDWLYDCATSHEACNVITQEAKPARMLHVKHTAAAKSPTVRLISFNQNRYYRFVALSHCWAHSKPIKTTSLNVQERLEGIPWDDMSTVFQDTVNLSLKLGIEYVWIDSLCIIQGDEADWLAESPKMGGIYQCAYVVFAAHGSALAPTKENKKCTHEGISGRISDFSDTEVIIREMIDHDDLVNPSTDTESWFGRAWCFQERLFSSRILHFGGVRGEIWFECNVHLRCECGGVDHVSQDGSDSTWNHHKAHFTRTLEASKDLESTERRHLVWQNYNSLCEVYTSQGLTREEDILMAFSSLTESLSLILGRYIAGLWEHNILIGLQWESVDGRHCHRHQSYVAPSFSWASRNGPIVWYVSEPYLTPDPEECDFAEVLDIYCETSSASTFGRFNSGYIKLRGYTTIMYFEDVNGCYSLGRLKIFREDPATAITPQHPDSQTQSQREDCCWVCMDAIEDMWEAKGKAVTCLDIMRDRVGEGSRAYVSALILWPVPDTAGAFRRIGFSTMRAEFFEASQLTEVKIV